MIGKVTRFVENPGLQEVFADTLRVVAVDAGTVRLELCVRRAGEAPDGVTLHPAARIVLPKETGLELAQKVVSAINAAAAAAGERGQSAGRRKH